MSLVDDLIAKLYFTMDSHGRGRIPDKEYDEFVLETVLALEKLLVNVEPKSRMVSKKK